MIMDFKRLFSFFIYLWMCNNFADSKKYNIRELCDVQDGSVRISLEQGSYIQLDMEVNSDGPGANCEIVIQSTHKDDGLLVYFEHFEFMGTNFATVFPHQACESSVLRMMDGEIHYLSTCIGPGLIKAPPMSTYSSLGAVRLQLLPSNFTLNPTTLKAAAPLTFSIIATASQKTSVNEDCPSGCCREPYMFKCPLINVCIDVKLTCNNVTNCGPRVEMPHDENGDLCNNIANEVNSNDNSQIILADPDISPESSSNNMLRPVWSQGTESEFDDNGHTDVTPAFYTRVELVCGIVSIALFCLAGIGVLVCKVRTNPQTRPRTSSSRRDSSQSAVYVINEPSPSSPVTNDVSLESPASPTDNGSEASSSSGDSLNSPRSVTTIITCKPKYFAINCEYCRTYDNDAESNYSVYIMDMDGRLHYPQCPKSSTPAPPSYDSLFPKQFLFPHQ